MNVWDDEVVNCCEAGTTTANWLSGVLDSIWNTHWLPVTLQLWVQYSHGYRYLKPYPYSYNRWPQNSGYSHTCEKPYWCNFLRGSDIVEFLPSFGICREDLSGDIILIFSISWLVLLPSKCFIIWHYSARHRRCGVGVILGVVQVSLDDVILIPVANFSHFTSWFGQICPAGQFSWISRCYTSKLSFTW